MSLEQLSHLAQIVGTIGAIISLLFVASQIRHNTRALERNEHNTTMTEWTMIRQTMVTNREVAELMSVGLSAERDLDTPDQMRLSLMLQECAWRPFTRGRGPDAAFSRKEPSKRRRVHTCASCCERHVAMPGGKAPNAKASCPHSWPTWMLCWRGPVKARRRLADVFRPTETARQFRERGGMGHADCPCMTS